ncbi:MAG: hypothetical protein LC640_13580, partial [Frankia sp.]|nr:hypothetical protein [Frankia sp.]
VQWSRPVPVNPGSRDDFVEHFTPAIDVGADGIVRVAYRTQQQARSMADFSPFVDTYYQQSTDHGVSYGKPLRVNRKHTDVRFAAYSRNSAFLGDYNQIATAGSWAYIVRCEAFRVSNRDKAEFPPDVYHQRAWVAVVDVDGNKRL